jgi:predicted nucleic acid-binding Zn ribbon protein
MITTMRNVSVGNIIQDFFVKNGKISLFLEQQAVELWSQTVGEFIAQQTTKIVAKQGVLYVNIPNAALKFEVMGRRSQIISKINETLGYEVIKGIIIK